MTCPMEEVRIVYIIFQLSPSAAVNTDGIFIELEKGAPFLGKQIRKSCSFLSANTAPHQGERFDHQNVGLGVRSHFVPFVQYTGHISIHGGQACLSLISTRIFPLHQYVTQYMKHC